MTQPAFDPLKAFGTLDRHGVRFVLIGGLGARLHGSPTLTNGLDVCYERSPENLERLAEALRGLKARLRGAPADVPFQVDTKALAAGHHFTFVTSAGNLDILGTPAGVSGYDELIRHATTMDLDGLSVHVASIDDLIAMKQAAGRAKDLIEVEVLGALRDEIEEQGRATDP
jgi:hypothetical protein